MQAYKTINGINYHDNDYAFCDRCGSFFIVNKNCLNCDVRALPESEEVAKLIGRFCFRKNGDYDYFDYENAAKIIEVMKGNHGDSV